MTSTHRNVWPYGFLLLAALACSLPGVALPTATGDPTATLTATIQEEPTVTGTNNPSTGTPSPTQGTPGTTETPDGSATGTITPTFSVPILTILESTNCRTGPGEAYQIVVTYREGKQLEVVGRSESGDFWLVKAPESPTGTCWLWGEFVEVTGSSGAVPSVVAPPTGTNPPPQQVILENWEFFCSGGTLNITIIWFDRADNETGYRIFRNGEAVADLPANTTTYAESTDLPAGQWAEYYIQVLTPNGSANSSIMRMTCG